MSSNIAVCIGINDYPGTGSDLHGCVNDAQDWARTLSARGFKCEYLLDAEATGDAIRDALRRAAARAQPGDTVVITYSGHGSFVPDLDGDEDDGYDEAWCPYDVVANGPIIDDELSTIYASRQQNVRWIVISDSCHSGTMAKFSPITTPGTTVRDDAPQRLVRFLPPGVYSHRTAVKAHGRRAYRVIHASPPGRNSVLLLAGCQDAEYSYDAWFEGRANGAFTFVALRELALLQRGETYEDWHRRIRASLPSQQYPQAPNLYGPDSMRCWPVLETTDSAPVRPPSIEPSSHGASPIIEESRNIGRSLARDAIARRGRARRHPRGARKPVLAEGDSWFDYPWADVLSCLEDNHAYDVSSVANKGDNIEDMAYSGGQLNSLLRRLDKMIDRNEPPRAVLLSGGGNDVAGDEFAWLLNHRSAPDRGLNDAIFDAVLNDRVRNSYATIIGAVSEICHDRLGRLLPILIHGYAHAVPDGRGFLGGWFLLPGPWLRPGFERKGYSEMADMQPIVDTVIDRLNEMQKALVTQPGFSHVHHVDLRDTIPRGGDYRDWWDNELHPTTRGFEAVAAEFSRTLDAVI